MNTKKGTIVLTGQFCGLFLSLVANSVSKHKANKADEILDAASQLFASRPFHEVRLEDIAGLAHVGKGTVYLYWSSKEEVYLAIIRRGFTRVLEQIDEQLPAARGAWDKIAAVVRGLVDFAFEHPGVYRVMRSGALTPDDPEIQRVRKELADRITSVIEGGVESGELVDAYPAITTQFILSFARGAALYPPEGMTRDVLITHLLDVLRRGIDGGRNV